MTETRKSHPGSAEAKREGCKCPVEENQSGKGVDTQRPMIVPGPHFIIAKSCPIHGLS